MLLVSWMWSFFAGVLATSFLLMAWGAVPATVFAIVGAWRGRCPKYTILMYFVLIPICILLFKAVFWISDYIMQPDIVSTTIFWGTMFIAAIGALFIEAPRLLKQVWRLTNAAKQLESEPILTGKEWLGWPLEKKQAFIADYLTTAFAGIGIQKTIDQKDALSVYVTSVDKTAEQHPNDPRMALFIRNFINEMIRAVIEQYKQTQSQK